jgi:hypothetical protein
MPGVARPVRMLASSPCRWDSARSISLQEGGGGGGATAVRAAVEAGLEL